MIKKLIFSLFTIVIVGSIGILGTQALLSDEVSLTANTFATGTVDLQIAKDDTSWLETVAGFNDTLRPGYTKSYFVWLKNNTPDIILSLKVKSLNDLGTAGVESGDVKLTFIPVNGSGISTGGPSVGPYTLTSLHTYKTFGDANNLAPNASQRYKVEVSMDDSATEGSISFDLMFNGTEFLPAI